MSHNLYPWHESYWQQLLAYVEQGRIPQALLMNGISGLGKLQLGLYFSQFLMCVDRQRVTPCGQCRSCQLFMAKTHPDFILLEPEEPGKVIGVDLIRKLITQLALKPYASSYRIILIQPAEKMNTNAANAFLKALEEPAERTVFLLLTEQMQQLPATIVSRCQKLLFVVPEMGEVETWLHDQGVIEQKTLLLGLAQGAPLKALCYAKEGVLEQRQQCFDDWNNILLRHACPVELAEKWHKISSSRFLDWLMSWTEDLIKCCFQADSCHLSNQDLVKNLHVLAKRLDLKSVFGFYSLLLASKHRFQTQLNKQLLFEEILIVWSQSTVHL